MAMRIFGRHESELSEEAQNTLLLYLGVMLGVNGTGALLRAGGVAVAKQVMKTIPNKSFDKDSLVSYFTKGFKNIWSEPD